MTRFGDALAEASTRLEKAGIAEPRLDARRLLQHAGGMDRAELIARGNERLSPDMARAYELALSRRLEGEPVHRITGRREFFGIELAVTPDVLDPRPDTEILVERALRDADGKPLHFADIGTGSGAIAIAMLSSLPGSRCMATDLSPAALAVARANAASAGVAERISLVCADMLDGIAGRFDCILSNPPYIPSGDIGALSPEVRLHDPIAALDGGADGLDAYRRLFGQAPDRLERGGRIYVEFGAGQAGCVAALAEADGWHVADVVPDLSRTPRVLVAERAASKSI